MKIVINREKPIEPPVKSVTITFPYTYTAYTHDGTATLRYMAEQYLEYTSHAPSIYKHTRTLATDILNQVPK
jgi:hypothetical protein